MVNPGWNIKREATNCSDTIAALLKYLKVELSPDTSDLADLIREYERLIQKNGKSEIGQRLGFNNDEIEKFNQAIREVKRQLGESQKTDGQRNLTIAQLRLLSWVETISDRKQDFAIEWIAETTDAADVGYKQIRALELIIRSLITERYENQSKLIARITELLGAEALAKWQKNADKDDILSGSLFSELATLFIDRREFGANYHDYYRDTPFLTLLNDKRVTLQNFLDDIRLVRNRLAHHKRITPVQIELLSLYYEEIVEPIQQAHDNQETEVNPSEFFDVSKEQMDRYFDNIHEDVTSIRSDIKELGEVLGSKLGEIGKTTDLINKTSKRIAVKTKWIAIGVASLILIGVATFYAVAKTKIDLGNVKKESSDDPRKELANLGVKWELDSFIAAIRDNDLKTVKLFLDGGFNFKNSSIRTALVQKFENDNAFDAGRDVIELFHSHGVDFIGDFSSTHGIGIPSNKSPLMLAIAHLPSSSDKEFKWLLENNDKSNFNTQDILRVDSDCKDKDAYNGFKALIESGFPTKYTKIPAKSGSLPGMYWETEKSYEIDMYKTALAEYKDVPFDSRELVACYVELYKPRDIDTTKMRTDLSTVENKKKIEQINSSISELQQTLTSSDGWLAVNRNGKSTYAKTVDLRNSDYVIYGKFPNSSWVSVGKIKDQIEKYQVELRKYE